IGHLDRLGAVARVYLRFSGLSYSARWPPIGAHDSLLCLCRSCAVPACSCHDGLSCRLQEPHRRDDYGPHRCTQRAHMIDLSRRKLILTGLAAAAGASGLAVAARLAQKYGLVPPDHGGIYGLGETLTYASQRLLTRHSLAREFSRSQISKPPFANEIPPLNEAYKHLQAGGFAEWQLSVNGMVA